MSNFLLLLLAGLFLIGSFSLTSLSSAFRRINKRDSKKEVQSLGGWFFYRYLHRLVFPQHEFEGIYFSIICAQNFARFLFVILGALCGLQWIQDASSEHQLIRFSIYLASLFVIFFLFGEYFPRVFGSRHPKLAIRLLSPVASIFMVIIFPFAYPFLKFSKSFSHIVYFDYLHEPQARVKQEIIDIIHEADSGTSLEAVDKKLIQSVMTFREKIAREVMVPRVDIFSLPGDLSIRDSAKLLENEGYSRIPVYRDTVDHIIGVLMYKDILKKYIEAERENKPELLDVTLESLIKNVLYTPETKKITHLLQEFRKKQVHLAIVVDEYGGTEGIVTIEDILEEIVGDIFDEYDEESEIAKVASKQADGSWLVDPRISIIDLEEQTGIKIPQEGDYDTLGGYIYFRAGTIPSKGFTIFHDDFKLEILKSSERSIEKIRLMPTLKSHKDAV